MIPGLMFLIFGVLIAMFPALLVALISTFFIVLGITIMSVSWAVRNNDRSYRVTRAEWFRIF